MDQNLSEMSQAAVQRRVGERHNLQERETHDLLLSEIVDNYEQRRDRYWDRDYSSIEAFLSSVEHNRERWGEVMGDFGPRRSEFDVEKRPVFRTDEVVANELAVRIFDDHRYRGRAVLGRPTEGSGPYPLVIVAHGAGSSPELVFGLNDDADVYHAVGRRLVEAGYAVLAPRFVNPAGSRGSEARMTFEILWHTVGKSQFGLEVYRIQTFLDYLEGRPEIDESRIAMWGNSMGGATTLFTTPLEGRIDAAICSSFFNDRLTKHVKTEPRYSHFRPMSEAAHFFVPGWFREFSDADLTSLICPRPFMVQAGIADDIDWRPYLLEEFAAARKHYERLGVGERIELLDHQGGHEIVVDEGIAFIDDQL